MRFEAGASNPPSLPGVIRTVCEAGIYGDGHEKQRSVPPRERVIGIWQLYFFCSRSLDCILNAYLFVRF